METWPCHNSFYPTLLLRNSARHSPPGTGLVSFAAARRPSGSAPAFPAHHLRPKDPNHPYGQLHGHSFHVEIGVSGVVREGEDWVDDFARIGDELAKVTAQLDHSYLNDIKGLELPTLERICVWIADRLQPSLPKLSRVTVSRPSLKEGCTLRLDAQ